MRIESSTMMSDITDDKTKPSTKDMSSNTLNIKRQILCPIGSTAVAYTDDFKLIAVGHENGSVLLYDEEGPTRLLYDIEMAQETEPCTDIKIRSSPKNRFYKSVLVSYLGGHVKLWDTKIGKCLFTMKEKRAIFGVNYHPKTSKFVTFGNDFKVYLYDEERRVTERVLACSEIFGSTNGHTDSVCCALFHPKNPFEIISSGFDGTIQFWDLRAPYAIRSIQNVVNYGEGIDISYDGKTILAGVSDVRRGCLRIYDYGTGHKIWETNILNTYVYCCRFLNAYQAGVGGFTEHSFKIVDILTGKVMASLTQLPACVMSFAVKNKKNRRTVYNKIIPQMVFSSGRKVFEVESPQLDEEEYY